MIELNRLGSASAPFVLNADLIKTLEAVPDTLVTLLSGEKILVRESVAEVVERVKTFRRSLAGAPAAAQETRGGHV